MFTERVIKTVVALAILSNFASAKDITADELYKQIPAIKNKLKQIYKIRDRGVFYQIKAKSSTNGAYFNSFVTKDGKTIIFGEGYDLTTNKKLEIPIEIAKYKEGAAFSFGTGKDEYYVFTDPECPFCKKFEKAIKLMKNKARFHIFMFPLSFHKDAKAMSLYILAQSKDKRAEAMHKVMVENDKSYKNFKPSKESVAELNKQMRIANELSVNSTPTIYNSKGVKVNWPILIKKYNIQMDVDKRAIDFLKKNHIPITMSKNKGKKEVYLFIDIENNSNFIKSEKFKKLLDKYNVNVVLYPKNSKDGLAKTLLIYSSADAKKAIYTYVNKKLSAEDRKKSAFSLKNKEINKKVMSGLFVSERAGVLNMPLLVSANGKIIKGE